MNQKALNKAINTAKDSERQKGLTLARSLREPRSSTRPFGA
jgi:hypothetical protein